MYFSDTTARETKRSSMVHLEKGRKKDEYIYLYNRNTESTSKNYRLVRCSSYSVIENQSTRCECIVYRGNRFNARKRHCRIKKRKENDKTKFTLLVFQRVAFFSMSVRSKERKFSLLEEPYLLRTHISCFVLFLRDNRCPFVLRTLYHFLDTGSVTTKLSRDCFTNPKRNRTSR